MINLKERLQKNEATIGSWLTIGSPIVAEIAASSGFDWLTIDMEHSVITLDVAQELIRVISLMDIVPLVRVGENDPTLIKRVMDAGAAGVIVPMVNNRDDAVKAVKSVKYPPTGTRGVGLARAQKYGFDFNGYKTWVEQESIVIAQIEHIQAIENLHDILSTPGIDGTIIGPYDLSGSIGLPGDFERAEVQTLLKQYEDTCRRLGKPMGVHVVEPDSILTGEYLQRGYSFIAVGLDTLYFGHSCKTVTKLIREKLQKGMKV